jgi:hypothetical protein
MTGLSIKLMGAVICSVFLCSAQEPVNSFIDEAKQSYGTVSENLLKSADAMPMQDYSFRPTAVSPTFGQLIADIAESQRKVCSAIDGTGATEEGPVPQSKADYLQALGQSVRKCAQAYAFVNSFNASELVHSGGERHSRLGLLFLNSSKCEEAYGRVAVYLRLKGIVPPSYQARLLPVGK